MGFKAVVGAELIFTMGISLQKENIRNQLAARGAGGEAWSLITGQEPLEELRRLIINYAQAGPADQTHRAGPLHTLGTLSYASLTTLVNSLSREACLGLFMMEQNCRAPAVTPGSPKQS